METIKVKRTYPIAGDIKRMGAVMENDQHTTIYYSDGFSPEFGHPIEFKLSKYDHLIGDTCIYNS